MIKPEVKAEDRREILYSNWDLLDDVVSDQNKGLPMPDPQKPIPPDSTIVSLTPADDLPIRNTSVQAAISTRESRRKYNDAPLSVDELSYLLWATQGVKRVTPAYTKRTVPSAGARHSIESYIYIRRVEGIESGLYRYLALQHSLCLVSSRDSLDTEIDEALHGQLWNSAAVFIWTTLPYRMEWRYSVASHKLILLDVGHVCQNLYLACESIGCGTCAIGAYDQEKIDKALGLADNSEVTIYAAPVGKVGS